MAVTITLEQVLDKIADSLILDEQQLGIINPTVVSENQKTVRDGIVSLGRTNADRMLLYQTDVKANAEDLIGTTDRPSLLNLQQIVNNFATVGADIAQITVNLINIGTTEDPIIGIQLYFSEALQYDVTNILSDDDLNPINVSQFVNINQEETLVDVDKAFDYLDTNIYELLPDGDTRQNRINKFFEELSILLPPDLPKFDEDPQDGRVDRDGNLDWIDNQNYYLDNRGNFLHNKVS